MYVFVCFVNLLVNVCWVAIAHLPSWFFGGMLRTDTFPSPGLLYITTLPHQKINHLDMVVYVLIVRGGGRGCWRPQWRATLPPPIQLWYLLCSPNATLICLDLTDPLFSYYLFNYLSINLAKSNTRHRNSLFGPLFPVHWLLCHGWWFYQSDWCPISYSFPPINSK